MHYAPTMQQGTEGGSVDAVTRGQQALSICRTCDHSYHILMPGQTTKFNPTRLYEAAGSPVVQGGSCQGLLVRADRKFDL